MDGRVIEKFWKFTEKTNDTYGCWDWKGFLDKSGLPVIRIVDNEKLKEYSPRKVSVYLSGADISEKKHCLAKCGNKLCVNPEHLVLGDEARFWSRVQKLSEPDSCWIWIGAEDKNGYGKFKISSGGKDIYIRAHRYSWKLYTGRRPPDSLLICHKCDHPRCVNPHHLFLGTNQDNVDDRQAKGRGAKGETNGFAKLTEEQVLKMRQLYSQGEKVINISDKFNSGISTIRDIIFGRTWKHLL